MTIEEINYRIHLLNSKILYCEIQFKSHPGASQMNYINKIKDERLNLKRLLKLKKIKQCL